jgi:hypothetical protein
MNRKRPCPLNFATGPRRGIQLVTEASVLDRFTSSSDGMSSCNVARTADMVMCVDMGRNGKETLLAPPSFQTTAWRHTHLGDGCDPGGERVERGVGLDP